MPESVILAIDQGTTSSRTLVFSKQGQILFTAQESFAQIYPNDGWVEHDPDAIWDTVLSTLKQAYAFAQSEGAAILGVGITNQRETTIVWERDTGKAIYNAIVWQDRRTAQMCRALSEQMKDEDIAAHTGLRMDPYFSATKIPWILDNVSGAREAAMRGDLAFGTIDSFLLYRLTHGAVHATDATNASRTNLFNIHDQDWDEELLGFFNVPKAVLPDVKDSAADFGHIDPVILGEALPILAMIGDQQSAAIGQACLEDGDIKSTYGTGCFVLANTGTRVVQSNANLLSTVAFRVKGEARYAVEGSIFIAGAAVQWLRDEMKLIEDSKQSAALAKTASDDHGIVVVPAFTGLGAPHWAPDARGAIFGLTRGSGQVEVVRATLESIAFQTYDLITAMRKDGIKIEKLKVDGGMARNDWFLQFLSGTLDVDITRPAEVETTALGVTYLSLLQTGEFETLEDIKTHWRKDCDFSPSMTHEMRSENLARWTKAVQTVLAFS